MKLQELWPLYVKWVIVWLVILPMILNRSGCYGTSLASWLCALSVGVVFGLCVPLIDEMFLFFCQFGKSQQFHTSCVLTLSPCWREFYFMENLV